MSFVSRSPVRRNLQRAMLVASVLMLMGVMWWCVKTWPATSYPARSGTMNPFGGLIYEPGTTGSRLLGASALDVKEIALSMRDSASRVLDEDARQLIHYIVWHRDPAMDKDYYLELVLDSLVQGDPGMFVPAILSELGDESAMPSNMHIAVAACRAVSKVNAEGQKIIDKYDNDGDFRELVSALQEMHQAQ